MTMTRRELVTSGMLFPLPLGGQMQDVRALTFDVFGTVVDWRRSIISECLQRARRNGWKVDCAAFADAWRGGYGPSMRKVRQRELPWKTIDELHRMILGELLDRFNMHGLGESELDDFNRAWHRLKPWDDAVPGLTRLKKRYIIASLSNGNIALLVNMAKNAGLPWDAVLSSELARHYKPDREVYLTAARLLGLPPQQCMMVAAHQGDLRAAASVGFRTAFVPRPFEYGPEAKVDTSPDPSFDVEAADFIELAAKLGA
jgi:2-haloacid dehalogenase